MKGRGWNMMRGVPAGRQAASGVIRAPRLAVGDPLFVEGAGGGT